MNTSWRRPGWLFLSLPLLVVCLVAGWLLAPDACFRGYWLGLMFWTQLSVGSLIVLLIWQLAGGRWGSIAAPVARASISGFFLLVPLFLPVLFALPHIFSWTQIHIGVSSAVLVNKEGWLNQPAFLARTVFYLLVLTGVTLLWRRMPPPPPAGPVLALLIVVMSLFCCDWMMSLQPTFYSSLYPFMYFAGAMVITFAVLTGITAWLHLRGLISPRPDILVAFGKMLFASVLFWGYIQFSQFIIVWTGNLPDEAEWYIVRSEPRWIPFTLFVILFHFAVPFCLLLSLRTKKEPRKLLTICAGLIVMHFLEVFWMMRPTPGEGVHLSLFDLVLPLLIGAAWLWFVLGTAAARGALETINRELASHV